MNTAIITEADPLNWPHLKSHDEKTRLNGLDTLRAIAIILVLFHHWCGGNDLVGRLASLGWIGVDLFFVLSGYLIGGQIFKELKRSSSIHIGKFMLRRGLRTLPSYYAVLALVWYFQPAVGELKPLWPYLVFLQNYFPMYGFNATWSLCIEEQFYFVLPFLALVFFRIYQRRPRLGALVIKTLPALLIVAVFVWRSQIWQWGVAPLLAAGNRIGGEQQYIYWIYFRTHTHLDGLIVGVAVALLQNYVPHAWNYVRSWRHWLLGIAVLLFLAAAVCSYDRPSHVAAT